ncbi:UDP-N-acetylmuramoyl-tripeptide--D-alanyl-D-alanine ligase [Auraticoccus cholistanensis]|uniref:UDP-N-acetylmuramoyl-tripeptide--D-alanyl-D- alanine ligase n=1 Tax=Auraticoccus cholistanensis TaxID=2656650 RepID=UPI0012E8C550
MRRRSVDELAEQVGGRVVWPEGREPADGGRLSVGPDVVTDSRRATPGALFVALPGEHADGHDYVLAAAAAGAVAVLGSRPTELPTVVVDDVAAGLGRLGRAVVLGTPGLTVVGITGSSGKTSTKDLLAQVLEDAGPCVSPPNSLNTEVGVPLTATRVEDGTRYLVSEMGARGIGHIRYLCQLTPPHVGVVLNVGTAHLGEFGDRDAVATAKGELVESLPASGWAVLNADDHRVLGMRERTSAQISLFAVDARPPAADRQVWAEQVAPAGAGRYRFLLRCADELGERSAPVTLAGLGRHQVANAVAAAAAALAVGVGLAEVAASLSAAGPRSHWRMELTERPDGVLVLNDAYNANPDSMRAALAAATELVTESRTRHPGARLVAVLGDMLELGEVAQQEHRALGALAAAAGAELVAIGAHADDLAAGFAEGADSAPGDAAATVLGTRDEVVALLTGRLSPGDVVLVKASRACELQTVASALARGGSTPPTGEST